MTALGSDPFPKKGPARAFPQPEQKTAESRSVAHVVETRVRALANDAIVPVDADDGLPLDARALLALLACCYTCQIYRSVDVAAAVCRDVTFRDRSLGGAPSARTVRRFRRKNRGVLHVCLVAGLRVLAEQKLEAGVIGRICETSLQEEARRRIITAMFIDSMELDREQTTEVPTEMGYLF